MALGSAVESGYQSASADEPQTAPPTTSDQDRNRILVDERARLSGLVRILLATLLCGFVFLSDCLTPSVTAVTQLYPAALLLLYGVRGRFLVGGFWLLSVVLIGAGSARFTLAELGDFGSGRVLSFLMVSATAIALSKFSGIESKLRRQALIDPLTGVFNRRSFLEIAAREEARTQRAGKNFAVLMVDIDHFKRINDVYGHPAGDAVIKELADVATRTLRPSDIFARYGGEEFVVSLPDTTQAQAEMIAERLRIAVEAAAVVSDNGAIRFTTSIGIAICSNATPLKEAIARADKALYTAKQNGRNRVEISLPPDTAGAAAPTESASVSESEATMRNVILVVDDEAEIRELIADWLRHSDYEVRTAGSAADALQLIESDASISLLLTDIVMPGELNGFDLGKRAEALRPNLKLLYMTGYDNTAPVGAARGDAMKVLQKPFRLNNMLESVVSALGT